MEGCDASSSLNHRQTYLLIRTAPALPFAPSMTESTKCCWSRFKVIPRKATQQGKAHVWEWTTSGSIKLKFANIIIYGVVGEKQKKNDDAKSKKSFQFSQTWLFPSEELQEKIFSSRHSFMTRSYKKNFNVFAGVFLALPPFASANHSDERKRNLLRRK